MSKQAKEGLSRRAFIGGAGGAVVTGTLVAALGKPTTAEAQMAAQAAPSVPWPVPMLNPDAVRDLGYWGYWANDPWKATNYGCGYGVGSALLAAIKAGLGPGSPWDSLPLEMFKWGKTGGVETGTLCGALTGAMPIFALANPVSIVEMGNDLVRWYEDAPLPSQEMDYLDSKRPYPGQPQSVSKSPLCHVSVTEWCKASGQLSSSTQRKTRCGKLTGDVAKMASIILNRMVPGQKYVPIYASNPPEYADCVHCHIDAPPPPTPDAVRLTNSLGTTNCITCHPDSNPYTGK